MKRFLASVLAVICVSALMATTVFAGTWRRDDRGWWYERDDGTYEWSSWVRDPDGSYYYLGADGYMLTNTVTPDGYYVDGSGRWVQNPQPAAVSSLPDGTYYGQLSETTSGSYGGITGASDNGNNIAITGTLFYTAPGGQNGYWLPNQTTYFPVNSNTIYIRSEGVNGPYYSETKEWFVGVIQNYNGLGLSIEVKNGVVYTMEFVS